MAVKNRTPKEIGNKDIDAIETILRCISKTQTYADFENLKDFEYNEMAFDASVRQVEIIGEAVKRLSEEIREKHPEIKWSSLAKMRDRLIHQYDKIESIILWDTIKKELPLEVPKLKAIKQQLLEQQKNPSPKSPNSPKLF
jgi:uncharacterized protein with HEPN domain